MRFTQKIFLAMLALMIVASYGAMLAIYVSTYASSIASERARSEMEQYAALLGISRATDQYELATILSGFIDAYASTGAQLELLTIENYGNRTIEVIEDSSGKSLVVTSGMPTPFSEYALRYRRSLNDMEVAQSRLLIQLVRIYFIICLLFAAISYFCLQGITLPLKHLSSDMQRFSEGKKLKETVPRGRDEVSELSGQFYSMTHIIHQKTEALEGEIELRQRFIDDLSHELRTPATSIHGYATLLRDAKLDPVKRQMALDFLVSESDRINDMAGKLLTLTFLSSETLAMETVVCEKLFSQVKQSVMPLARDSGVEIQYHVESDVMQGDETLMLSLIINLLQNAIRASEPGGTIAVSMPGDGSVLTVEDHGRGMTEEQISHALEPFYKADKARSRAQGGVGLGLSICAAIVRAHGANLSITSAPGEGTRVEVKFTSSIQSGGDLDAGEMVFSSQGKHPKEEEKIMKRGRSPRKARGTWKVIAIAGILIGSLLSIPVIFESALDFVIPAKAQPEQDASALIPLPAADERFESFSMNRDMADDETQTHYTIMEQSQKAFEEQYGGNAYQHYACYMVEYADSMGIDPLPTEPVEDRPYVLYTQTSVQLVLPDRMLTEREMWQIERFTYEVLEPAQDALYYSRGTEDSERPFTQRERSRMEELTQQYENEGLRPQEPIPTSLTEDGFYHDEDLGSFHVALTRTYELTDEQLLQIIDLNHRATQAIQEEYIEPARAEHTDEEWIAIALDLLEKNGLPFEEKEGAYWSIEMSLGWEASGASTALLTYGTEDDQVSMEYCYSVSFDPSDGNRAELLWMPKYKGYDVGASLLSTNISDDEWKTVLSGKEWLDIAESYARKYIYGSDRPLTVQVNEQTNHDPYDSWGEEEADYQTEFAAVYIEVIVAAEDGSRIQIFINPDTKQVNGYTAD